MPKTCEVCGAVLAQSDIDKGYDAPTGETVILTDDDLDGLPIKSAKTADVVGFFPAGQVDPVSLGKAYFVEPQDAGLKPYALLRDAMAEAGQVALVRIALRTRESLAVVRPREDGMLIMQMLAWAEEVRTAQFGFLDTPAPVTDPERAMAKTFIDALTIDFNPADYHSDYDAALRAVVMAKLDGTEAPKAPDEAPAAPVADLTALLAASVAAAAGRKAA
jgi:DNA end-binding protein Ku